MRRKLRFFWLKVPNIFPDARRVARIAHTDSHLKNLQWLLIFQLHVQRLCVWRSKYLVLCPSMTVHGLRAGTGAVASRSALNYADFFWNSAIVQLMVLVEKNTIESLLQQFSLPSLCFSRDFPVWSMQYLPVKRSVRRDHLHMYPLFTENPYSYHDGSWFHLMSCFCYRRAIQSYCRSCHYLFRADICIRMWHISGSSAQALNSIPALRPLYSSLHSICF